MKIAFAEIIQRDNQMAFVELFGTERTSQRAVFTAFLQTNSGDGIDSMCLYPRAESGGHLKC